MKRIQKWFETIAGISQDEHQRLARAWEIFGGSGLDVAALEVPACWRRQTRVQNINL